MNVETPPAAGELDFAANKEAYERYFINVAGILASNNEFNGPFLDHLNRTLEVHGFVLTRKDSIENYARRRVEAVAAEVAAEGERLRSLDRTRYINSFQRAFRRGVAEYKQEIAELKKQLEEHDIQVSAEAQRLENDEIRDLDSPENDFFFNTINEEGFRALMDGEIPPGIFTPKKKEEEEEEEEEEGEKKKKKRRKRKAGGANRKLDPELGGSSLKDRALRF